MCGIICIVSRPSARPLPVAADLLDALEKSIAAGNIGAIAECATLVAAVDAALRGESGTAALVDNLQLVVGSFRVLINWMQLHFRQSKCWKRQLA